MEFEDILSIARTVAVGRLCLSLLPPGWPGEHNRQELGPTLCASWLLGTAAWALAPWLWLWAGLMLARISILPGSMRPRHERERGARPLWLIVFLLIVTTQGFGAGQELFALCLCAVLFAYQGRQVWQRRADRRARLLGLCGLACPLVFYLAS